MKLALVTGAYKGMGLEWVKQLAQEKYTVILTARNLDIAQKAADSLNFTANQIIPKDLDISSEADIIKLKNWVDENFGKIDLIINNAGINPKDYADKSRMAKAFYLDQLDIEELFEVIKINSIAPLLMVKNFRELLKKSDQPKVVNISSWLGSINKLTFGGHYGYVGSKNLLNIFNKSMSYELINEGIITVNINPGWVKTDMGGQKATLSPEQSINSMIQNVLNKVSINDSGKFFNYDGTEHPW